MRDVRQDSSEYFRRWFFDENFDLIIWYKLDRSLHGFQLCYDKAEEEKALMWICEGKLSHYVVDAGEDNPARNHSPMLRDSDGRAHMQGLLARFKGSDHDLPPGLKEVIETKIREYGGLVES